MRKDQIPELETEAEPTQSADRLGLRCKLLSSQRSSSYLEGACRLFAEWLEQTYANVNEVLKSFGTQLGGWS